MRRRNGTQIRTPSTDSVTIPTEDGVQPGACTHEDDQKNDDNGSMIMMTSGEGPLCDDEYNGRKDDDFEVPSTQDKHDVINPTHTLSSS